MRRQLTRKEFLATATKTAVAAASVGAVGAVGADLFAADDQFRQSPIVAHAVGTAWPWPYAALDPEDVRKRGHKNYYDGGCGYGAFNGLVSALAETVGEPWTLVPTQMFYYGSGGGAGWGTLCGALNGAAAAISMAVDRTNASAIVSELFGWYTATLFPSDISNDYARQHVFLIDRNDKALPQTLPGSPLCHASVTSWCTETGFKATAPERAERCARLTGDTAARAAELLNAFKAGQFRATFVPARAVTDCQGCHGSAIANVQSGVKMDCQGCHRESWAHLY
ncbi:MAG: C-GCAxxG-C-C family protein [Vicinamibacterales bacterium]